MELRIDLLPCDLGPDGCAVPVYDAARTAEIEACREGRTLRITIPATPRNDAVVGFAGDPHAAVRFNAALHRAELTAQGATLIAGTTRLLAVSEQGYTLEIRDGGAGWAEQAAQRMFNTLGVPYNAQLTPTTIFESWTDDSPVKFFPIHRDEYPQINSSTDLLPAERLLSVDDYHPFLHLSTLVRTIFQGAGYNIESRFLESEFFRSLYMSGAYSSRDTSAAIRRMGFFARRLKAATATANYAGRVYANAGMSVGSVGNIVETATPQTPDADGLPIPELANNGGCFSLQNGNIVFTPPTEVSVGFEYFLKYTTDHRILSRTLLRGFDSIYLGPGAEMRFTLANRYKDHRAQINPNQTYRVIVFNHTAGAQYRLTYTWNLMPEVVCGEFNTRSALVTTLATGVLTKAALQIKSGANWIAYSGDWALYDGYVGETGQTTIDLRVRTSAEIITPTSPKYFNQIYFFGAEQGMTLTVHKECSLQPRFLSSPGFGSTLCFADVAQHRIRQSELLEALAHLFNLRFYTDPMTRSVYIEPADDFAGAGPEVDWSAKVDRSQPIVRADIAPEVHERRSWGYQLGDGAVSRLDALSGAPFGQWSFHTDSFAAKQGEKLLRNPLFQPTLSVDGYNLNARSALIMQVGDRDAVEQDGSNFTPRIVRYAGMHPLPEGERWGYPSNQAAYPLAAFHYPGDQTTAGFTLCFEDRDGVQGLHRFYDRQLEQQATRERITLSLQLAPHHIETLLTPGTKAPDIRSRFRLGTLRTTLDKIESFDPHDSPTRCTFTRLITD